MTDQEVVDGLIRGHRQTQRAFVEEYQHLVYSVCHNILHNHPISQEAAQDTFIKAMNAIRSFDGNSTLKTWLYRIAYRTAIDFRRKSDYKKSWTDLDSAHDTASGDLLASETMDREQRHADVRRHILALPDDHREILTLYYLRELTMKEICAITNYSESNVKVKLYRARKAISEKIKRDNRIEVNE